MLYDKASVQYPSSVQQKLSQGKFWWAMDILFTKL